MTEPAGLTAGDIPAVRAAAVALMPADEHAVPHVLEILEARWPDPGCLEIFLTAAAQPLTNLLLPSVLSGLTSQGYAGEVTNATRMAQAEGDVRFTCTILVSRARLNLDSSRRVYEVRKAVAAALRRCISGIPDLTGPEVLDGLRGEFDMRQRLALAGVAATVPVEAGVVDPQPVIRFDGSAEVAQAYLRAAGGPHGPEAAIRTPDQVAAYAADPAFEAARRAVEVDIEALRVARRVVEDVLVDLRDSGTSAIPNPGNGFVIRSAGSPDGSSVIRLATGEGLEIGIKAYLAELAGRPADTGRVAPARMVLGVDEPRLGLGQGDVGTVTAAAGSWVLPMCGVLGDPRPQISGAVSAEHPGRIELLITMPAILASHTMQMVMIGLTEAGYGTEVLGEAVDHQVENTLPIRLMRRAGAIVTLRVLVSGWQVTQIRSEVDALTGSTQVAVEAFLREHPDAASVGDVARIGLILRYAAAFQLTNRLTRATLKTAWERVPTTTLPEPLAGDLRTLLEQAIENRAQWPDPDQHEGD